MKREKGKKQTPSYIQIDFLLLQFILSEFLSTFNEVKNLHFLFLNLFFLISSNASKKRIESELIKIKLSTQKLAGASHDQMRLFTWKENGLIPKLNHYCALFSRQFPQEFKPAKQIYKYANKSWLCCIELHDSLHQLMENPSCDIDSYATSLRNLEKKIYTRMLRFSKILPIIISKFSDNENVMFFIIRHRREFEALIDESFVRNLIEMNYTNGVEDLKKMLLKNYNDRKFNQLLPIIVEKLQNF